MSNLDKENVIGKAENKVLETKNSLFETKEQYLEMLASWKSYYNHEEMQEVKEFVQPLVWDPNLKDQYRDGGYKFNLVEKNIRNRDSLQAYQFAIYQLLRGRDWRKAFHPNTRSEVTDEIEVMLNVSLSLNLKPFGDHVTPGLIKKIRENGIPSWDN